MPSKNVNLIATEKQIKEMNVYQRMHFAGSLLSGRVRKDGENKFDKYRFVSHDGAVEFVRDALQAARLILTIDGEDFQCELVQTLGDKGKSQFQVTGVMNGHIVNVDNPKEDRYKSACQLMRSTAATKPSVRLSATARNT